MIIFGVDPGFEGGIARLCSDGTMAVIDMPTVPGQKGKTELNLHDLFDTFAVRVGEDAIIWLEKVGARPGQGVSSMFRFGQQVGALEMAAAGHGHQLRYVTPSVWKSYFGLSSDKGVARGYAMKRFPAIASMFLRAKDDGRAEACLIALYGAEHSK